MHETSLSQVRIEDAFWSPRLEMNAARAIRHQWEQLEQTGCIDNFRVAAGERQGFREGWFFADSDAYKWLDAACRIAITHPSAELRERIDAFVKLVARAQQPDGYLYTYNQIHFPGQRWVNLQIEHELYCLGHLIEACVSYDEMQGARDPRPASERPQDTALQGGEEHRHRPESLPGSERKEQPGLVFYASSRDGNVGLVVARKAADLLVRELMEAGPEYTDGHEEIELALVKLYRRTGEPSYLELARRLVERRGRIPHWASLIRGQEASRQARQRQVRALRAAYVAEHPEHASFRLPPDNVSRRVPFARQRRLLSALSGKMFQQHRPVHETRVPVGHAVRFCYLETAAAMLAREKRNAGLRAALEATWRRMVERRMYVTGGLGALPAIEGFGRDYELDPEASYSETCAALGCLFWNWEMALLTREARYADLFEWQLYNAASVGMGGDGTSYLYNNPLTCRGGIERRAWFAVPCCPSNLSRTWAALGRYLFSAEENAIWVHQYVGCRAEVAPALGLRVESALPWEGRVRIEVEAKTPAEWTLHLRIPSWTRGYGLRVNGRAWEPLPLPPDRQTPVMTACAYAPHGAFFVPIRRTWAPGDTVEMNLPMPVVVRRPSGRVRGSRGTAAITRGPLVYCMESVDNPGVGLFLDRVDVKTLQAHRQDAQTQTRGDAETTAHLESGHSEREKVAGSKTQGAAMGEVWLLRGQTVEGKLLTMIPYFAWANRGPSQMNVMVRV